MRDAKLPQPAHKSDDILSFIIQFNPEWDEMVLEAKGLVPFGIEAQKHLMEGRYFDKFKTSMESLKIEELEEPVRIEARFKYINKNNERKFETVIFNTKLGVAEYLDRVVSKIIQRMQEMEHETVVLHMCFIKFYFKNVKQTLPPPPPRTIQINNKVYRMDEDCNLIFIEEKEPEDQPGFRW